jgi:hypothetical protein
MKIVSAHSLAIPVTDDEVVHLPFTLYLNSDYENPHIRAAVARRLRMLCRVVDAFDLISPARRM